MRASSGGRALSHREPSPVNTREISRFEDWDEPDLATLLGRFVRTFRRLPSYADLVRFRRARGQLQLRLPAHVRRRSTLVTTR